MTLLRTPAAGLAARMVASRSRKRSVSPKRRIRRSSGPEECWKLMSKYGTTPGVPVSTSTSDRPHLGGLQVGQPHPLDAVQRGQLGQQGLEQPQVAEVLAVGRGVLADQDELAHALVGEPARLGEDVGRAAGDERAAEARDRAEGAAPVAAGRQLERGDRPALEAAAQHGRAAGVAGQADVEQRRGLLAGDRAERQQLAAVRRRVRRHRRPVEHRLQVGRQVGVAVEAEHRVGLGQLLGELLAVPLGEAARPPRPWRRRRPAASRVSIESFFAEATKPQVLTTATSVGARRPRPASSRRPPAARRAPRSRPRCGRSPASSGRRGAGRSRASSLGGRAAPDARPGPARRAASGRGEPVRRAGEAPDLPRRPAAARCRRSRR